MSKFKFVLSTFLSLFILFSHALYASFDHETLSVVSLHDMSEDHSYDYHLALMDNGEVWAIEKTDTDNFKLITEAFEDHKTIALEKKFSPKIFRPDRFDVVKSVRVVDDSELNGELAVETLDLGPVIELQKNVKAAYKNPLDSYELTVLDDSKEVSRLFRTMNRKTKRRSQCYNRAHVWNYELKRDHNLNSGKIWIFFTAKYIRNYDYKWWFHVAPYTKARDEQEEMVLDREFSSGPRNTTRWKNIFMKNNAFCPTVERYSDYRENQYTEDCYLIFSSMYFWQPYQIKNLEDEGEDIFIPRQFYTSQLRTAYRDGFRGWRDLFDF